MWQAFACSLTRLAELEVPQASAGTERALAGSKEGTIMRIRSHIRAGVTGDAKTIVGG